LSVAVSKSTVSNFHGSSSVEIAQAQDRPSCTRGSSVGQAVGRRGAEGWTSVQNSDRAKSVTSNNDISIAIQVKVSNVDGASSINKRNHERGRLWKGGHISSSVVNVEKAVTLAENSDVLVSITINITTAGIITIESTGNSSNSVVSKLESSTNISVNKSLTHRGVHVSGSDDQIRSSIVGKVTWDNNHSISKNIRVKGGLSGSHWVDTSRSQAIVNDNTTETISTDGQIHLAIPIVVSCSDGVSKVVASSRPGDRVWRGSNTRGTAVENVNVGWRSSPVTHNNISKAISVQVSTLDTHSFSSHRRA